MAHAHAAEELSRVDILGVHVNALDMSQALAQIERWIDSGAREYVCVADVNSVVTASRDDTLRPIYNRSGMTVPDGVPLVWAGHRAGFSEMERVCGPDLMPALLTLAAERGWSSYFYGGGPGIAQGLVDNLSNDIAGLQVAGVVSPPFRSLTEDEKRAEIEAINQSGAEIVWVGLGAPKQERWMAEHRGGLNPPVLIGVGAAFDMHAGTLRRAPSWMQRNGLEWAYRLYREPRRLWRRYFRVVPAFLWGNLRRRPRPVEATR